MSVVVVFLNLQFLARPVTSQTTALTVLSVPKDLIRIKIARYPVRCVQQEKPPTRQELPV